LRFVAQVWGGETRTIGTNDFEHGASNRMVRCPAMVRLFLPLAALLVLLAIVFERPLVTHAKVLLLLSQELPQIPVKPLGLVTPQPIHEQLGLDSRHGPVVADLFRPAPRFGLPDPDTRPALILAMGVKVSDRDRPVLLNFARSMARLGFIVLWPRLEPLDQGASSAEEPDTFVAGFRYLQEVGWVARERISLLGFSIGASTAAVAAADPSLADQVRALIFFGGYYDLSAYLLSLATGTIVLDDRTIAWQPADDAVGHARLVLEAKGGDHVLGVFDAASRDAAESVLRSAPAPELDELRRLSPFEHVASLAAPLFILHDRGDPFVPYVESIKLRQALPPGQVRAFLLTGLFEHAQFKGGLSWQALRDVVELYGFLYAVLNDL
jgi:fermentation-respiration switch protein FrsA (DUF1100 family)